MDWKRRLVLSSLLGAALITMQQPSLAGPEKNPPAKVIELSSTDVVKVKRGDLQASLDLFGVLQPLRQAVLSAQIEAPVAEVLVRPGDTVKPGQVLLRFENVQLQNAYRVRDAALEKSRASMQMAHKAQQRNRDLLSRNFIAANAADTSDSALAVARAQVKEDEAQLAIAKRALGDASLKAPFSAMLSERLVEPGARTVLGQKLLSLVDLAELEFSASVTMDDLAAVQIGQAVQFSVSAYPGQSFAGTIERIAPSATAASRMVPVFVRVKNTRNMLKTGMFGQARVVLASVPGAHLLPFNALRGRDSGQPYVLVVRNGKVERQALKLGAMDHVNHMAAIDGVQTDEVVVIAKLGALKPGDLVKLPKA